MSQDSKLRILLLHAHPAPHKSRVNRALVEAAAKVKGVTVRHLYELYPDFLVNVREEQRLLQEHDVLVMQHPLYWYSAPALVKEWMDLVLEYGWAYGVGGTALKGKLWVEAVTAGGSAEVYCERGRNKHPVRDYLLPFEQSAGLCGMTWLAPFIVHGVGALSDAEVQSAAGDFVKMLEALRDGRLDVGKAASLLCVNQDLEHLIKEDAAA